MRNDAHGLYSAKGSLKHQPHTIHDISRAVIAIHLFLLSAHDVLENVPLSREFFISTPKSLHAARDQVSCTRELIGSQPDMVGSRAVLGSMWLDQRCLWVLHSLRHDPREWEKIDNDD